MHAQEQQVCEFSEEMLLHLVIQLRGWYLHKAALCSNCGVGAEKTFQNKFAMADGKTRR